MKKKMILVDASGLLFRAYFAMLRNPLRTSSGKATSAVFGFLRMLFNLVKKYPCHQIVTAFDVPRSTLERTKQYQEYKATRKETPPDLIEQIPLAKECLEKAGIPALTVPGHEADDVIASIVKSYKDEFEIIVFTGDKDLLQLVQDDVFVAIPDKNEGVKILDREGVKEYKGVFPEEIPDFLAILGDTSDNIPGIKGIGEKGAVVLIEEYHSLSNIYDNIDNIKPTLAKKLQESKENGFLSLDLIKLQEDLEVPLPSVSEDILTISHFVTEEFTNCLQELELFSLLKELSQAKGAGTGKDEQVSLFGSRDTDIEIQEFGLNTLDILSKSEGVGLQFIDEGLQLASTEEVFHLKLEKLPEFREMIAIFFEALEENEKRLVVFDQKAILHALAPYKLKLPICDDLKIMAYLLDPARSQYNIHHLSLVYLGKNEETARIFYELKQTLGKALVSQGIGKVYYNIDMPLRKVLFDLERVGVAIDSDILTNISSRLEGQLTELEQTIYHLAGREFNILSPKQLGVILFEELGLKPYKKTKTKSYSTDEESLEYLALSHPLPKEILKYRSLSKFKSTYTDALPKLVDENGRIHTTLHQTVTATGRLSSGDPNLQNIPIRTELGREIRKAFIPSSGKKLISADYSQIELRLFASLSKDPKMVEFFQHGGDVHRHTASEMFHIAETEVTDEQRRAAKTVNYGISYGMSAFRLSNELNIEFGEARQFIDTYFETFPGVREFMMSTLELACKQGFVTTKYGRIRPTPELLGKTPDKLTNLSHFSRFAINAVVQGTAADIIKMAMLKVQELIDNSYSNQVQMILQVHDELLFEAEPNCVDSFIKDLKTTMKNVAEFLVPLDVEVGVGDNWSEVH